jgi:hypothetical protein
MLPMRLPRASKGCHKLEPLREIRMKNVPSHHAIMNKAIDADTITKYAGDIKSSIPHHLLTRRLH